MGMESHLPIVPVLYTIDTRGTHYSHREVLKPIADKHVVRKVKWRRTVHDAGFVNRDVNHSFRTEHRPPRRPAPAGGGRGRGRRGRALPIKCHVSFMIIMIYSYTYLNILDYILHLGLRLCFQSRSL